MTAPKNISGPTECNIQHEVAATIKPCVDSAMSCVSRTADQITGRGTVDGGSLASKPFRVIIIGATSGMGEAIAKIYGARPNVRLGLAARREAKLEELRHQLGPDRVAIRSIDVTKPSAPAELRHLISAVGGMDLFIYTPGLFYDTRGPEVADELATVELNGVAWARMVLAAWQYYLEPENPDANASTSVVSKCSAAVKNAAAAIKSAVSGATGFQHPAPNIPDSGDSSGSNTPHKTARGRGGRFAIITSVASVAGLGIAPAYSASKAFQTRYIDALEQLCRIKGVDNIQFHDIRPGFVNTPLLQGRRYPLEMTVQRAAAETVDAIDKRRRTAVIDWRWRCVVAVWRLVPQFILERLPILKSF